MIRCGDARATEALQALRDAVVTAPELVVAGLEHCRQAIADRVAGTLLVEHNYLHPEPSDSEQVGSRNLIDDLLAHAIEAGNHVVRVDDAALHEFAGVALLTSSSTT